MDVSPVVKDEPISAVDEGASNATVSDIVPRSPVNAVHSPIGVAPIIIDGPDFDPDIEDVQRDDDLVSQPSAVDEEHENAALAQINDARTDVIADALNRLGDANEAVAMALTRLASANPGVPPVIPVNPSSGTEIQKMTTHRAMSILKLIIAEHPYSDIELSCLLAMILFVVMKTGYVDVRMIAKLELVESTIRGFGHDPGRFIAKLQSLVREGRGENEGTEGHDEKERSGDGAMSAPSQEHPLGNPGNTQESELLLSEEDKEEQPHADADEEDSDTDDIRGSEDTVSLPYDPLDHKHVDPDPDQHPPEENRDDEPLAFDGSESAGPNSQPSATPVTRSDAAPPIRRSVRSLMVVGDGGEWDKRAIARAQYWTSKLEELKRAGQIGDEEWDGSPITPKQWNERTGSPYLRELFTRDRASVYQSYRRASIKGFVQVRQDPASIDTERSRPTVGAKRRKLKSLTFRKMRPLPSKLNPDMIVIPAIGNMDTAVELRDIINSMDPVKKFRDNKGLVDNSFHRLMSTERQSPGDTQAKPVSRACLAVLLYFMNPRHGDALIPGSSDVVYSLAFNDAVHLIRMQPGTLPVEHTGAFFGPRGAFAGSPVAVDRWNGKDAAARFSDVASVVAQEAREGSDYFRVVYLAVNAFMSIMLTRTRENPEEEQASRNLLVGILGMDFYEQIDSVLDAMEKSFLDNLALFLQRADRRLSETPGV